MRVVYSLGTSEPLGAVVCAVSTFDGVHSGHLALAARAEDLARAQDVPAVAVVVWEGERAGPAGMLTLLDERLALLAELVRFDAALVLSQAPGAVPLDDASLRDEIGHLLQPVAQLRLAREFGLPAVVPGSSRSWALVEDVVGDAGNADDGPVLANTAGGRAQGYMPGQMRVLVPTHAADDTTGKWLEHARPSERTRGEQIGEALLAGDVRRAETLLGYPYAVGGVVVSGDRRGRLLGFPTANLRLDARKVLPADGIYAVRSQLPGEPHATHPAVVSLGVRPQFGADNPRLLEVYLLDAALDLYGLPLGVEFVDRLREERRFGDVEALKAQMARDVALAREVLTE